VNGTGYLITYGADGICPSYGNRDFADVCVYSAACCIETHDRRDHWRLDAATREIRIRSSLRMLAFDRGSQPPDRFRLITVLSCLPTVRPA
jgi:hypothetical protein